MNKKIIELIDNAITLEEESKKFYTDLMKKTTIKSVKDLLKMLSSEEEEHKKKLEEININDLEIVDDNIKDLDLSKDLMLTPINEFKKLKEMFKLAIDREIDTQQMYIRLSEAVNEKKATNLFKYLAAEEKKHSQLLNNELKNTGL